MTILVASLCNHDFFFFTILPNTLSIKCCSWALHTLRSSLIIDKVYMLSSVGYKLYVLLWCCLKSNAKLVRKKDLSSN